MAYNSKNETSEDLGTVCDVDNPQGVTWVDFNGLALTDYQDAENDVLPGIVPIATKDLEAVVHRNPEIGDKFWVEVNLGATSMADVEPSVLSYEPPITQQEIDDLFRIRPEQ